MIAIIDYKLSNLFSVKNALEYLGLSAVITSDKKTILKADAAVLPGVGAYGDAMKNLKKLELINTIHDFIKSEKPFMGVCLGMQLLFNESEEFGCHKGLKIIAGTVKKFPDNDRVPQICWNTILPQDKKIWKKSPLRNMQPDDYVYFVHSYYVEPQDPTIVLAQTAYAGINYCSALMYKNVFATQFHPKKVGRKEYKYIRIG